MKQIESLRKDIREKDREIVRLLNERAAISLDIGKIKSSQGREIYDPAQEKKVREGIMAFNEGPLEDESLNGIFREIISVSRALQAPLSIAYFGPEASFTHAAAQSHFGASASFQPCPSISEVFDETEREKVHCGIVPIENSSEGSVKQTLDRLVTTPLQIRAEIFLRISHSLLSMQEDLSRISRVYSHPQALAQCRIWLRTHLPSAELIAADNTAAAAQRVREEPEIAAAVGNVRAASVYQLKIVMEGIEDNPSNTTRFIVIGKGNNRPTGNDKTSILFSTTHAPGSLYRALETLANEEINMNRIESYPSKMSPWSYLFFVDFEGHREDIKILRSLQELKLHTTFTKVLGSYPKGDAV